MSPNDSKGDSQGESKGALHGSPTTTPAAQGGSSPSTPPPSPTNSGPRAGLEIQPPAAKPPAGPPGAPGAKTPPKNPGFVTVTVDGKEVVAKPGTNMIEAAKTVGADIPYYCYHPRLSIAANCRMCLVEVSNSPKLVPACQTPMAEGMAITTQNARVQESQRSVMEFLLLNHPVDCAICDQAGECKLQDYYMRYSFRPSRLEGRKVLKEKRKVLGPLVVLDQERCVLCTRCVRFMAEVANEPQLGVFGRGSHEVIDVFPGAQLDSNYSGNTVDICPVGALLNRDYRFRARTWFQSSVASTCTGCSRGCNTFVDFMGQDTYRYRPRENEAVNKSWLCDQGRLSYKYLNTARVLVPTVGRGAEAREATRIEAVDAATKLLKPRAGSNAGVAVLASPVASVEDLLAGLTFAKTVLGAKEIFVGGRPNGQADHFLMTADKNPNRKGLEWIAQGLELTLKPFEELQKGITSGRVQALYALGTEVPGDAEAFAIAAEQLEVFVAQAFNESPLTAKAHVLLPASPHTEDEGSFVNLDGRIQRFRKAYPPRSESLPHWRWAQELGQALGGPAVQSSSREVFTTLAPGIAELQPFDWDAEAPPTQRKGITPSSAGADGRPPGYREVGVPRVRGI